METPSYLSSLLAAFVLKPATAPMIRFNPKRSRKTSVRSQRQRRKDRRRRAYGAGDMHAFDK